MQKSPFKHMAPYDYPLFASFVLTQRGRSYDRWEFDVCVGCGTDPGPLYSPAERKQALYLSSFKIDALGWKDGKPTIFEVKPDARLSAYGQIKGYCYWWTRMHGGTCSIAVITDTMNEQTRILYEETGVEIILVQPANLYQIQVACQIVNTANCQYIPEYLRNANVA